MLAPVFWVLDLGELYEASERALLFPVTRRGAPTRNGGQPQEAFANDVSAARGPANVDAVGVPHSSVLRAFSALAIRLNRHGTRTQNARLMLAPLAVPSLSDHLRDVEFPRSEVREDPTPQDVVRPFRYRRIWHAEKPGISHIRTAILAY